MCAFVAAVRRSAVRIQEYMRGCIPRAFSRVLTVPSIICISSSPAPRDSAQPTHTYPDPGNATVSRLVKLSFTKSAEVCETSHDAPQ
jgi:hypothetical protein